MRNIFKFLTLIIPCLATLLSGCRSSVAKENSAIGIPNKAIVYYKCESKELDSKNRYFSDIIKFTNARFEGGTLSEMEDDVDDETINTMKKAGFTALELIYNKEQKMAVTDTEIKYHRLFFRLEDSPFMDYVSGDDKNNMFQYGDSINYKGSSLGPLAESKVLISLVKKIF